MKESSLDIQQNILAFYLGSLIKPSTLFREIAKQNQLKFDGGLDLAEVKQSTFLFNGFLEHFTLQRIDEIFANQGYATLFYIYFQRIESHIYRNVTMRKNPSLFQECAAKLMSLCQFRPSLTSFQLRLVNFTFQEIR